MTVRLKLKVIESSEPMIIENNNKTSTGGKGGNDKTLGWLKYYNLAIQDETGFLLGFL